MTAGESTTGPVTTRRRDAVALVTLNRPEAHNSMNDELVRALAATMTALGADDSVRAVVLTGHDAVFSAGGDVRWIAAHPRGAAAAVDELARILHETILAIRRMPKPVVAAIGEVAAGAGMSLALACDLRVMAKSGRFILAYTSRGLSPDGGGSFALPRLVGLARAIEIAALDEPIPAGRALEWGLVTRVVEDGRQLDEALVLAAQLADRSTHAFGAAKRLLCGSFEATLEGQLELERQALIDCAGHPDGQEGIAAFEEKRAPVFRRAGDEARERARR